jgi:hypothetical protein
MPGLVAKSARCERVRFICPSCASGALLRIESEAVLGVAEHLPFERLQVRPLGVDAGETVEHVVESRDVLEVELDAQLFTRAFGKPNSSRTVVYGDWKRFSSSPVNAPVLVTAAPAPSTSRPMVSAAESAVGT